MSCSPPRTRSTCASPSCAGAAHGPLSATPAPATPPCSRSSAARPTCSLSTARGARALNAEDVSVMWVVDGALELLSDNIDAPGERWELSDFPATARLLDAHVSGQVVVGDAASDPVEIAELARLGYGAVLMIPVR